jgi:hypothetical protein
MSSRSGLAVSKVSLEQVCEPAFVCAQLTWNVRVARVSSAPTIEGGAPATASAAGILTVARGRPHVKQAA